MLRVVALWALLFTVSLHAEESARQSPSYTFELQGGLYQPTDENWESYYGSKNMMEMGVSFAYRIFSVLDIGTSASFGQDNGTGRLPISQISSGKVSYEVLPIDVYAVLRLRFSDRQWIVPFAGGGYTRFFYRQSVDEKGYARGSVDALHARAGLQILLDPLDGSSARDMFQTYGVLNSYLVLEGKMVKAQAGEPAIDLGGVSYRMGILLEY